MATNETNRMVQEAWRAAGTTGGSAGEILSGVLPATEQRLQESLESLRGNLEQLRQVSQAQAEATGENTQALRLSAASQSSSGWGKAGDVARGALGWLGAGMSLSPLLSGLLGLFRKKETEAPAPLAPYVRPAALHFEGAAPQEQGASFLSTDYGADGSPRVMPAARPAQSTNVTVQVQAMDSRSFLDHRDEIARAVREAMLNSHALNDVVGEL